MNIHEIQIRKIDSGKVKGQAKINFEWFWLSGFKVVSDEEGKLYVTPPSYFSPFLKKWNPIFTTIKKEDWQQIQKAVLDKYNETDIEEVLKDMKI